MKRVRVRVGISDIIMGRKFSAPMCPVARAISRATGDRVNVTGTNTYLVPEFKDMEVWSITLPSEVRAWISRFDGGDTVNPIEFMLEIPERNVPKISGILANSEHTWGPQVDKKKMEGNPFWIFGARESEYVGNNGEMVRLIVLNCGTNDSAPVEADRFVITVGWSEDRAVILGYFAQEPDREPLGPSVVYEVQLKNKQTFWRLEDAE